MLFKITLVWIPLLVTYACADQYFTSVTYQDGVTFRNSTINNAIPADHVLICFTKCEEEPMCKSLSYNYANLMCGLNEGTIVSQPMDVVQQDHVIYMPVSK